MECRACGHKNDVWDADKMERTHTDTKEFMQITSPFCCFVGPYDRVCPVKMFICPECGTVRADRQ